MYVYGFYEINYGNATIYVCTRTYVMFTHLLTQIMQREMYVCMYASMYALLYIYDFTESNLTTRYYVFRKRYGNDVFIFLCPLSHR